MPALRSASCTATVALAALATLSLASLTVTAADGVGLKVPEGFEVTLYADDDLAHDIYSMTIDSQGRVVVSGVGYTRILIDADQDGQADQFRQFADGPANGAQGMYFHGRDLICVGDAGLIRYRDRDGDDRADGAPDTFLRLATGSEHHSHAIRRGPDGWWYMISGNNSGIDSKYVTLKTSPVSRPESGVLMRLKPDLTGGEIVADGYRNAYDFDFHGWGDVFTFDSDGERDVSLPWYRPTRVFQMLPGSHAGWISRSWKRPEHYPDMPPVLGDFGRGSPTGVVVYRHDQFPEQYRNAVIGLDWTFGRVFVLPTEREGSVWKSEPFEFMSALGQFGFAPTDAAVGPDGSLYVSVGGRGTRGSVYRVRYVGQPGGEVADDPKAAESDPGESAKKPGADDQPELPAPAVSESEPNPVPATESPAGDQTENVPADEVAADANESPRADSEPHQDRSKLLEVLDARQPLSSWSRNQWTPVARSLGAEVFREAVRDSELSPAQRVRAIEVLTDSFDGIDADLFHAVSDDPSALVVGRAIWGYGRTQLEHVDLAVVAPLLTHDDPFVVRSALETLLAVQPDANWGALKTPMLDAARSGDRFVRQLVSRVVGRWPETLIVQMLNEANGKPRPMLTIGYSLIGRGDKAHTGARQIALVVLESSQPIPLKREAVRLLQLALGDVGPGTHPPTFDSYWPRADLAQIERELDPVRTRISQIYPAGDPILDEELGRVIAMLAPFNRPLMERFLSRLTDQSDPVADIHHLHVLARLPIEKGLVQSELIARILVGLEAKIRDRGMKIDSNWEERIRELYSELVKTCPALPAQILREPGFGRPEHVMFLTEIGEDDVQTAVTAFVVQSSSEGYPWTNDVVFVLGESTDPAHRDLIRQLYSNLSVRDAVLSVLSAEPNEQDRGRFLQGMESSPLDVLTRIVDAVAALPPSKAPEQAVSLVRTLRRLGTDPKEYELREKIVRQLQTDWGETFGFEFGKEGYQPQPDVIGKWGHWAEEKFPDLMTAGGDSSQSEQFAEQFGRVDWKAGDVTRGRGVFEARSCARCHGGRQALGPDLAGVGRRFSRPDLMTSIVDPNRDVSPRYQTTVVETSEGKVYTGLIVYQSVDGLILRNATNQTFRIEAHEIEDQRTLSSSLMPVGLLKDISDRDLIDLFAYLESLGN